MRRDAIKKIDWKARLSAALGRLGYSDSGPAAALIKINPAVTCTHVHHGGRVYKKGVVYDPMAERLPRARLGKMMKMRINGVPFFVTVTPEETGGKDNGDTIRGQRL